ncbi:MAG: hypothetical protein ACXWCV_03135 [Caldimonas sp.]
MDRNSCNRSRFVAGDPAGHYESWFLRANHAERPLAFWIRYTVFCPKGRPNEAVGELWAIYFDGESGRIAAAKEVVAIDTCRFSPTGLDVQVGTSLLSDGRLSGQAASGSTAFRWDLRYEDAEAPLLLLPEAFYERGFPKAKALVGAPNARFDGVLVVNGETLPIEDWVGSQNHNWGTKHTDSYAWGQVAGFDGEPGTFLECSTARLKLGPFWTPPMTVVVLRLEGREIRLNTLSQALKANGSFDFPSWHFESRSDGVSVSARIDAPKAAFVGLAYGNPPGGTKTCLNTKLASCELKVEEAGKPLRTLSSRHRAAFEILTDRNDHGIAVAN